jgi:hypothetical protein
VTCADLPRGLCFAANEAIAVIVRMERLERYARDAYRTCHEAIVAPVAPAP